MFEKKILFEKRVKQCSNIILASTGIYATFLKKFALRFLLFFSQKLDDLMKVNYIKYMYIFIHSE